MHRDFKQSKQELLASQAFVQKLKLLQNFIEPNALLKAFNKKKKKIATRRNFHKMDSVSKEIFANFHSFSFVETLIFFDLSILT